MKYTYKAFLFFVSVIIAGNMPMYAQSGGFVSRNGMQFYCDGRPFYFAGANCYDLFTFGDGSQTTDPDRIENYYMDKERIDAHLQRMANDGVKVLRTWGFSHESWHGFEPQEGSYYEAQFCLFDYIMESAKNHGIRIIIVLENYWEAYGGINTRLQWEGLNSGSHEAKARFFTHSGCKTQYKNYVRYFINRVNHYSDIAYKNDPAIFAWELMNEPRYQDAGENSTGESLRAWVDEMASYIKSLDPNHMVGTGIEGHEAKYHFGGDEGNPFVYIHQSPSIDFTSAHPYTTEPWAITQVTDYYDPEVTRATQMLIRAWADDSHNVVGKPFFLGEWNAHTNEVNRPDFWSAVFQAIESENIAGSAFWWYADRVVDTNFGIMEGDPELSVFRNHSSRMASKTGQTGQTSPPAATSPPASTNPPQTTIGDVNMDGNFNIVDALLVAQYYVGLQPANFNDRAADTNCDGTINIVDALLIAQYYVGLIAGFC
ncbi:MAG: cellulase family glycosylhydrolase [Spirochaetales bacterium]|nr:cellulase family glycosylhydrolase [Spirochaetales bacterium]